MKLNTENLPSWLAGAIAGCLYCITSASTITWVHESQDSGELAACAAIAGIPHPTGYPLYMIAGWIAIHIFGWFDPGRVMVLTSVVCASIAAGIIARTCAILIRAIWRDFEFRGMGPGWIGFLAAIVSAINPVMWSQAVVCEVYSLALLLQAVVWLLLAKYVRLRIDSKSRDGDHASLIGWIGLMLGLILAHHISGIMIIFPVVLILLFYPPGNWGKIGTRFVLSMIPGLLLYLYLPIRSSFNPPIDWGNPQTFGNFIRHISAFQYRGNIFGVEWPDFIRRLTNPEWPGNWGTLFILLALAGFCVLFFSPKKHKRYAVGVPILVYVLWSIVFAFSYNASDYEVFTYPMIMPIAILIAVGTGWVVIMLQKTSRHLVWLLVFMAFIFIGFAAAQRWLEMDASDPIRNAAANFASREIRLLPENAIVITNSDGQLFSLLYGINVGVIDPIGGEKIGPRKDIDALTPYWITTDWFYENHAGTDLAIERWEPQGIEDYNRLLREFIDMNIANRPVFVDGYVLSMIQVEGDEYRVEGGTALMRIIPAS